VRGLEQIPWLYGAGSDRLEKTGFGRWRWWLAAEGNMRRLEARPLREPAARSRG
jgi:hypothetical protein